MRNQLDREKAIEVLLFAAERLGGDVYASLKAIYHAEKHHLEHFGSQIYGEEFAALQHGPVPEFAYGIVKHLRMAKKVEGLEYCENFMGAFDQVRCSETTVVPARSADTEYLSQSDIVSLNAGIERVRDKDFNQIKNESHDDAYDATSMNSTIAIASIASSLPSGSMIIQHLQRHNVDEFDEA